MFTAICRKIIVTIAAIILVMAWSVESIGQDLSLRPLQKLIDCPSTGGPEPGSYDFELRTFSGGGVLAGFTVGLFPRFKLGLHYGGSGILGYENPDWHPQPGINVAYRIIDESIPLPALAVGFTNQGYGYWDDDAARFQYREKGFYAVLSKNFSLSTLGEIGWHAGVNDNPAEGNPRSINMFAATDIKFSSQIGIIAEYSAALDDRKGIDAFGTGKGYMHGAFRWNIGERLALDFILRDVLVNQDSKVRGGKSIGREIRISYVENI